MRDMETCAARGGEEGERGQRSRETLQYKHGQKDAERGRRDRLLLQGEKRPNIYLSIK